MLLASAVVIACLLGILAVALWTPIDLSLAVERETKLRVRARLTFLGGLVTKEIGVDPNAPRVSKTKRTSKTKTKSSGRGALSRASRVARSQGFIRGVVRLARRIAAGIEVRRAELWARAGFDDPADTGRLFGVTFAWTQALQSVSPVVLDVGPDFSGETFVFRARGDVRVVPARIAGPALAFTLSRPTLRAFWAGRG